MGKKTELLKEEKNKKKKYYYIAFGILFLAFIVWVIVLNVKDDTLNYTLSEDGQVYTVEGKEFKVSESATNMVLFEVKKYGAMVAELYPDIAPITVNNFKELVNKHYYDGIIFHRVIKDFMIQAGDPTGTGTSGSSKTIKGEFSLNGVKNDLSHTKGVLSMARVGAESDDKETSETMDSASSQFFIVQKDSTYLDGRYAAFGKLINGYDVLDNISTVETNTSDKPVKDVVIKTVVFVEE